MLQLRDGDGNTRLFHQQASHRQRKNIIRLVKHNGNLYTRQDEVASAVDAYFGAAFGASAARIHTLNLDMLGLPHLDLAHLEHPFTADEVEKVIKSMPMDKASGPDGFTGRFYASCWHVIAFDFMRALDAFYRGDMCGFACDQ